MGKAEFAKLLDKTTESEIDWEANKAEWLQQIGQFFEKVEQYTQDFVGSGKMQLSYSPIQITEGYLGTYEVNKAVLTINGKRIELIPKGRNVIGSPGRLDMTCNRKTLMFVLANQYQTGVDWKMTIRGEEKAEEPKELGPIVWKIVSPESRLSFIDLDEDSFFDALQIVLDES